MYSLLLCKKDIIMRAFTLTRMYIVLIFYVETKKEINLITDTRLEHVIDSVYVFNIFEFFLTNNFHYLNEGLNLLNEL